MRLPIFVLRELSDYGLRYMLKYCFFGCCFLDSLFSDLARKTFSKEQAIQLSAKTSWAVWVLAGGIVMFLLKPNIQHAKIIIHMVYPTKIEVLNKLNEVSKPDDFVVTWWTTGQAGFTVEPVPSLHLPIRHLIII